MIKIRTLNPHKCSECKKDIPVGSEAWYETDIHCSEKCFKKWERRFWRIHKEVYGE